MGISFRLHGDVTLNTPDLVETICPKCQQKTEWVVTRATDGDYIKKCKVCGTASKVKKPITIKETSKGKAATTLDSEKVIACPFCYREFSIVLGSSRAKSFTCPYCLSVIKK